MNYFKHRKFYLLYVEYSNIYFLIQSYSLQWLLKNSYYVKKIVYALYKYILRTFTYMFYTSICISIIIAFPHPLTIERKLNKMLWLF